MLSSLKPKTSNFQARQSILRHGMCFNYNFVFSCNRRKSLGIKFNVILKVVFAIGVIRKGLNAKNAVYIFFCFKQK